MSHTCHAKLCETPVQPKMLMCLKHWRMVPRELQDAVWANYRPGQEVTKRPLRSYFEAADAAIAWVFEKERKKLTKRVMEEAQGRLF